MRNMVGPCILAWGKLYIYIYIYIYIVNILGYLIIFLIATGTERKAMFIISWESEKRWRHWGPKG